MTYNTGNELGSVDARDLSDNIENLDRAVNSDEKTWNTRLGKTKRTWTGLEELIQNSGSALAFPDYVTLSQTTPLVSNALAIDTSTGLYYYWDGEKWNPSIYQTEYSIRERISEEEYRNGSLLKYYDQKSLRNSEGYRQLRNSEVETLEGTSLLKDEAWNTSDYLKVSAGENYRFNFNPSTTIGQSHVLVGIYDENKVYLGSLIYGNYWGEKTTTSRIGEILKISSSRYYRSYFQVPLEGYIRVTSVSPLRGDVDCTLTQITDEEYLSNFISLYPREHLINLNRIGKLSTPIYKYNAVTLAGDTGATSPLVANRTTDFIPVKVGQYLNIQQISQGNSISLYDVSGKFVRNLYSRGVGTLALSNFGGIYCLDNYRLDIDGSIRVLSTKSTTGIMDSTFISITDYPVKIPYKYYYGEPLERIKGAYTLNSAGWNLDASNYVETKDTCFPIILRKGEILEITTEYGGNSLNTTQLLPDRVLSTTLLPEYSVTDWMTNVIVPIQEISSMDLSLSHKNSRFVSSSRCDLMVHISTNRGGVLKARILTYKEFCVRRNEILRNNLPLAGYLYSNPATQFPVLSEGLASIAPVLMLKGEVLEFVTNSTITYSSPVANNPSNQVRNLFEGRNLTGTQRDMGDYTDLRPSTTESYVSYGVTYTEENTLIQKYKDHPSKVHTPEEYLSLYESPTTPPYYLGRGWELANTNGVYSSGLVLSADKTSRRASIPLYVPGGQAVRIKGNTGGLDIQSNPFYWDSGSVSVVPVYETPDVNGTQTIIQAHEIIIRPENDVLVCINNRLVGDSENPLALEQVLNKSFSQLSMEFITDEEYLTNTQIDNRRSIHIPTLSGIEIRMVNTRLPWDRVDRSATKGNILQFWQSGSHLFNLKVDLEIQGQGTANNLSRLKLNHNWDLYNNEGKSVALKLGEWRETEKLVLKAYITERSHLRDTNGAELWRQARRNHVYPENLIYGPEVLDQLSDNSDVRWATDSVCSTQGTPVTYYVGGQFYGLYTLRTKKDRSNYLLKKKINNHIWLQSDYTLNGTYVSWSKFDYGAWEIANPSGFDAGVIPPEGGVKTNIDRFWSWLNSCVLGTESFSNTYGEYINLNSWMDYLLVSEMIKHSDGANNNILLNTWDGSKWYINIYDMDWTFGTTIGSGAATSPSGRILSSVGIFKCIYEQMPDELKSRYKELRDSGIFSMENFQSLFIGLNNRIPNSSHELDESIWGTIDTANPMWILSWLQQRLTYMDSYFNY